MENMIKYGVIIYAVIINIIAVYITVYDKKAAQRDEWRISESTLLLTAALSGCAAMYITMRIIHHKTKHPKFMIGIPVIFILEVIIAVILMLFFTNDSFHTQVMTLF